MDGDNTETSINKHVKDILRITGQNEVIQSFVRSDVSQDSEETVRDLAKAAGKDKKSTAVGWKMSERTRSDSANADKNKDFKDDQNAKMSAQLYQQLGKDAQGNHKEVISKKLGNKWGRRQRLIEEVYTDKDRAAAVNLGTRDIKQSLKLKKLQDRSRILEISEEAHPGTLLALAIHRFKTGDVYVAVKFVNKALELNPYDKNALVARSRCYLFMGKADAALKDAEQALSEDRCFIKGLYQKAEALYHLARFEYSLMYFHRGLHLRSQNEDFRQGVHKAKQAILNTIGKSIIGFEKLLHQKKNMCSPVGNVNQYNSSVELKLDETKIPQDKKLLKELQVDKVYFEKLIRNPELQNNFSNVSSTNAKTKENKILIEAKEGMKFLENRQNFWRQQQALKRVKVAQSTNKSSHKISRKKCTQKM